MVPCSLNSLAVDIRHIGELIQARYLAGSSLGEQIPYLQQALARNGSGAALLQAEQIVQGGPFLVTYGENAIAPENYRA